MIIYSHRGIDLDRTEQPEADSMSAFRASAAKGFGVEFRVQMLGDNQLIVAEAATVEQWSKGKAKKPWNAFKAAEIEKLQTVFGPVLKLTEVLDLLHELPAMQAAIRVHSSQQTQTMVTALLETLRSRSDVHLRLQIHGLRQDAANFLRKGLPYVGLGPTVSHDFDIKRYQAVHGALMTVKNAVEQQGAFDWVWLDEWDRVGENETKKLLYEDVVEEFRERKLKVGLISPELHLDQLHQDGDIASTLLKRWPDLIDLKPDAICTNYPARFSILSTKA